MCFFYSAVIKAKLSLKRKKLRNVKMSAGQLSKEGKKLWEMLTHW